MVRKRRPSIHQLTLDQVQIADLAQALHEMMPVAKEGEEPQSITGSHDGRHWRRMKATYANGWVVVVNFTRDGKVSSAGAKLSLRATVPANG